MIYYTTVIQNSLWPLVPLHIVLRLLCRPCTLLSYFIPSAEANYFKEKHFYGTSPLTVLDLSEPVGLLPDVFVFVLAPERSGEVPLSFRLYYRGVLSIVTAFCG